MKQIKINDELTTYWIDSNGRLLNKKTNNYYKGSIRGGYLGYDLTWKGKRKSYLAHRLVAEYYLDNKENKPVVNHINGNKLDNRVENLEWVNYSENELHAYETGLKEKTNGRHNRIKYECDLEDEIWKKIKDTRYSVSNYGRFINNETNFLLKGKINNHGYCEYCLTIKNKKITYLGHRLVYEYFGEEEIDINKVINHKDGCKSNNKIENLEQISNSENVIHALYELNSNPRVKPVLQYDLKGNFIAEYSSCAEAARVTGCHSNHIGRVCNKKMHSHHNFIWRYKQV